MLKKSTDEIKSTARSKYRCQYHIVIVYSDLNKSGPWIYRKGKIMFHMAFPYDEVCDSDHYCICAKVQKKGIDLFTGSQNK